MLAWLYQSTTASLGNTRTIRLHWHEVNGNMSGWTDIHLYASATTRLYSTSPFSSSYFFFFFSTYLFHHSSQVVCSLSCLLICLFFSWWSFTFNPFIFQFSKSSIYIQVVEFPSVFYNLSILAVSLYYSNFVFSSHLLQPSKGQHWLPFCTPFSTPSSIYHHLGTLLSSTIVT